MSRSFTQMCEPRDRLQPYESEHTHALSRTHTETMCDSLPHGSMHVIAGHRQQISERLPNRRWHHVRTPHPSRATIPSVQSAYRRLSLASEPKVKIVTMYIDQPGGYPSSKPTPFDELPMGIRMAEKCPDQSTHIALCLSVCLSVCSICHWVTPILPEQVWCETCQLDPRRAVHAP